MALSECIDHGCKGISIGYATATYQGRFTTKHRVILLKRDGLDFDGAGGLEARHLCNNPRCINPTHLEWGTPAQNAQDKIAAGTNVNRPMPGEENGRCILTDAQVVEIRRRYVKGCRVNGLPALSRDYGVSTSQLHRIVKDTVR